jgi:hypothetical protein
VLVADGGNSRVRRVSAATGVITTLAGSGSSVSGGDGGAATSASFAGPIGVAVGGGPSGPPVYYIAEFQTHRVRRVGAPPRPTPSSSRSPSPTPYCAPSLFRSLPRMDLVGSLVGTALTPGAAAPAVSELACRQACCDAPACDGYAFDASALRWHVAGECYLYVNVTQLVPSSGYASGLREAVL